MGKIIFIIAIILLAIWILIEIVPYLLGFFLGEERAHKVIYKVLGLNEQGEEGSDKKNDGK